MAFTNYKQLKAFIIQTLRWKALPRFANEERYGAYRFKEFIYPWARFFFPRISKISTTDDAFLKEFTREDYAKYPTLIQEIGQTDKTTSEQVLIVSRANQQAVKEEAAAVKETVNAGVGEKASSMRGATRPPVTHPQERTQQTKADEAKKTPVPEAFKTNPLVNSAKNFNSAAQRFTGINLGRIGRGLGQMAGGLGRGIAGPTLNGAYNLLGKTANAGLNVFEKASRISGSRLKGFGTGKKVVLAFSLFGLFFGFSLIAGVLSPGGTATSGAITSIASTLGSCPSIGVISTPYGYNIPGYPAGVVNSDCGSLFFCHNGIDIAAAEGTLIKSTLDGTVSGLGNNGSEGRFVEITSLDQTTIITFEHLQTFMISKGDKITKGNTVGTVGSGGAGVTGPHVHYKIKIGGSLVNPLRVLGTSASLDPKDLTASDNLNQNNYANINPTSGNTDNWGQCLK